MRKVKYFIPLFILFLTIGFATVNQTLSIKGSATNQSNIDDFTVYFSDVLVNDVQDLTLVKNENELVFTTTLEELGNQYKITYDITNGSKYFDAAFVISCTQSNNYLKVTNQLDTSNLPALETRTGNLTLEKTQTNAAEENTKYTVTCTITATPVERETTAQGEAATEVEKTTFITGEEINISGELFNVISDNTDTVTLFAKNNLSETSYKQTATQSLIKFATSNTWSTTEEIDLDIATHASSVSYLISQYVSFLKSSTNDSTITGDLISKSQLISVGCDFTENTCNNSQYANWLVNGQFWWTKTYAGKETKYIFILRGDGVITHDPYDETNGVRPTITISKETLKKYV